MKTIFKVLVVVLVVVGLLGLGLKKVKAKQEADAKTKTAKIYPIVVKSYKPQIKKTTLTLPSLAEVKNEKDVLLLSKIAARVIFIKHSGSRVKKGEVIAKLDTTEIDSKINSINKQIDALKIALKNLEDTHKRTLELLKVNGASIEQSQKEETQIAELKAKLSNLNDNIRALNNNLTYATITSPVNGVLRKTFISKGSTALPGRKIASISSNSGFYLLVRTPSDISVKKIKFRDKLYDIVSLNSTFRGLTEYKVYVDDKDLISGDRVKIDVVVFNDKATFLPFDTILHKDNKTYVLEINQESAIPKEIHIIQSAKEGVVVKEDLSGKNLVLAKEDVLLRLLSGYKLVVAK